MGGCVPFGGLEFSEGGCGNGGWASMVVDNDGWVSMVLKAFSFRVLNIISFRRRRSKKWLILVIVIFITQHLFNCITFTTQNFFNCIVIIT